MQGNTSTIQPGYNNNIKIYMHRIKTIAVKSLENEPKWSIDKRKGPTKTIQMPDINRFAKYLICAGIRVCIATAKIISEACTQPIVSNTQNTGTVHNAHRQIPRTKT